MRFTVHEWRGVLKMPAPKQSQVFNPIVGYTRYKSDRSRDDAWNQYLVQSRSPAESALNHGATYDH